MIGIGAGAKGELNLGVLMGKRGRIHASTLRARPLEEKALTRPRDGALGAAAARAGTRPGPDRRHVPARARPSRPTSGSPRGGKLGKIVLVMGD